MREISYTRLKHVGSLLLLTSALSCGVKDPEVAPQSVNGGNPQYPPLGASLRFTESANLIEGKANEQYRGSLTIWNPDADPEKVAAVMELSKLSREDKDKYLLAKKPVLDQDAVIQKKRDSINLLKKTLGDPKKELEFYFDQEAKLLESSRQWADTRVSVENKDLFTKYCDVILLQFASSSFLRNNSFAQRPLPFGICEHSYSERGMFKGASCMDPAESGGNFFACTWEEGVLKSSLTLYSKTKKEATVEEAKSFVAQLGDLKTWLEAKESWVVKIGKLGEDYKVGFEPNNKNPKISDILDNSPEKLFSNAEDVQGVRDLAQQRFASDNRSKLTFNDRLFNFHRFSDVPKVDFNYEDKVKFTALMGNFPQLYGTLYEDPAQTEVKKVEAELQTLEAERSTLLISANRHYINAKTKDGNAAKLIKDGSMDLVKSEDRTSAQNLGLAIYPEVLLSFDRKGDAVKVSFELRERRTPSVLTACFDWAAAKQVPCEASGTEIAATEASFDKESGRLLMTTSVERADGMGFVEKAINDKDADFSLVPLDKVEGSTLELEFFPRRFGETLRTVTGTLSVKDKQGKLLYLGSLVLVEPCE